MKASTRIKRIKRLSRKDVAYLDLSLTDRDAAIRETILSLPKGTYTRNITGKSAPALTETIQDLLGPMASLDVTERLLRGLSVLYPKQIRVSFTLGLQEIEIR